MVLFDVAFKITAAKKEDFAIRLWKIQEVQSQHGYPLHFAFAKSPFQPTILPSCISSILSLMLASSLLWVTSTKVC